MKVDRYISERSPETYALTAYGAAFPAAGLPAEGGWTVVGASDTWTYPEAVCNEIEFLAPHDDLLPRPVGGR